MCHGGGKSSAETHTACTWMEYSDSETPRRSHGGQLPYLQRGALNQGATQEGKQGKSHLIKHYWRHTGVHFDNCNGQAHRELQDTRSGGGPFIDSNSQTPFSLKVNTATAVWTPPTRTNLYQKQIFSRHCGLQFGQEPSEDIPTEGVPVLLQ